MSTTPRTEAILSQIEDPYHAAEVVDALTATYNLGVTFTSDIGTAATVPDAKGTR